MLIDANGWTQVETLRRPTAPHGTGDLLAGLYLGHRLLGSDGPTALHASVAAVEKVIGGEPRRQRAESRIAASVSSPSPLWQGLGGGGRVTLQFLACSNL